MSEEKIIKDRATLARIIESLKQQGKRIVLTNGGFNLLHVGHIRSLADARRHGDILVVAVKYSDATLPKASGFLCELFALCGESMQKKKFRCGLGVTEIVPSVASRFRNLGFVLVERPALVRWMWRVAEA